MSTHTTEHRTSQAALDAVATVNTGTFIDGQWSEAASGARFDVLNPATEEVIATVADGGPEDAGVPSKPPGGFRKNGPPLHRANAVKSCAARMT